MKINDVLNVINNKTTLDDTKYSKIIFDIEEGREDQKLTSGRRDWLILADIYNNGEYNQKFHLENYLKFKLNDGLSGDENFENKCFKYIKNGALRIYIMEVILSYDNEYVYKYYLKLMEYYNSNNALNKCPKYPF
ncbi:hypothetical protein ACJQWY_01470 [Weissella kandleri]|uniref:hypothetical protein n=1 Tax=Weissella kandleri TaxID=1616 RepID=UPI00387E2360